MEKGKKETKKNTLVFWRTFRPTIKPSNTSIRKYTQRDEAIKMFAKIPNVVDVNTYIVAVGMVLR